MNLSILLHLKVLPVLVFHTIKQMSCVTAQNIVRNSDMKKASQFIRGGVSSEVLTAHGNLKVLFPAVGTRSKDIPIVRTHTKK